MLYLWDKLIREDDEVFMHYFIICFLEYHSEQILTEEYSQIPTIISRFSLKDKEIIDKIFESARILRTITPYSFRLFFSQLDIFKPFSKRHKELFEHYKPDKLTCLPIMPSEVFFIAYNNIITCPDKHCRFFNNLYDYEQNFISKETESSTFNNNHHKNKNSVVNDKIGENTNNPKNIIHSSDGIDYISNDNNISQQLKIFQQELIENEISRKNSNQKILYINNGKYNIPVNMLNFYKI